ncbi:MAG TPA: hypothetical protein VMV99_11835 [Rhodanobacter sp.]|nr:hypothetical protein [Rhodanobacter sp.]
MRRISRPWCLDRMRWPWAAAAWIPDVQLAGPDMLPVMVAEQLRHGVADLLATTFPATTPGFEPPPGPAAIANGRNSPN